MEEIRPQLPRTLKTINDLDYVIYKIGTSRDPDEELKNISDYERMLWDETEMAIASTLYSEAPEWAKKIAEYIIIMADMEGRTIKPKIEWQ